MFSWLSRFFSRTDEAVAKLARVEGHWTGLYYYPSVSLPVPFSLKLSQTGIRLTGHSQEPNTFGDDHVPMLTADWTGELIGETLELVKTYDGSGGVRHSVTYHGHLENYGTRIGGRWSIKQDGGYFSSFFALEKDLVANDR